MTGVLHVFSHSIEFNSTVSISNTQGSTHTLQHRYHYHLHFAKYKKSEAEGQDK